MKLKKLFALSITTAMLAMSLAGCGSNSNGSEDGTTPTATVAPAESAGGAEEDDSVTDEGQSNSTETTSSGYEYGGSDKRGDLTGLTATEIVSQMGFGYNVGNTLDATGGSASDVLSHEQSWGNPVVTQEFIDAVVAQGFDTIRIPTTWYNYISDDGSYTIDPGYLARVQEIVDYCYQDDVYVILNIHHESWLNNENMVTNEDEIAKELSAVWTQIADYFADYDQHLIFEVMNEPRLSGTDIEWSGNAEAYETVNYFIQTAVDAIRGSEKGNNAERCIMIPGYAASNSSSVIDSISFPTYNGEAVQNIILSVHSYAPYDFCLSDTMVDFDPDDSNCTSAIDQTFTTIKAAALDLGIPVVIGETGATNKDNTEAREAWAQYFGTKAAEYGVPIIIWDNGYNGNSGGECHAYFNRSTGEALYPSIFKALFDAKDSVEWGSALEAENTSGSEGGEASLVDGRIIVSYSDGLTSSQLWDSSYISVGSNESYFSGEKTIAVVYTGNGSPKLILDSEAMQQWWMPVEPSRIESVNGKSVAYFDGSDIKAVLDSFGITAYSQLRNLMIVAADDNITTYEVSAIGDGCSATFKVNGQTYYSGTDIPADPEVEHMTFLGWYTTKDYEEGTEYTADTELTEDVTVYAKLGLAE